MRIWRLEYRSLPTCNLVEEQFFDTQTRAKEFANSLHYLGSPSIKLKWRECDDALYAMLHGEGIFILQGCGVITGE